MSVLIGTATAIVVSELIKMGRNRQARKRADARVSNDAWFLIEDANFFYWYGVAVRLTDNNEKLLLKIRIHMEECRNFNPELESDWLICEAQQAIRRYSLAIANSILIEMSKKYDSYSSMSNPIFRLSEMESLKGRVAYHQGKINQSLAIFLEVERMRKFDSRISRSQWQNWENLIYTLKSMVAANSNRSDRSRIIYRIFGRSVNWEKELPDNLGYLRKSRARALLINSCRLGNMIDDLFIRLRLV